MKRIGFALLAVWLLAFAVAGQETFTVGIDRSTSGEWDTIVARFEQDEGIEVSVRAYAQSSVAQQVVFQAFSRSGNHNFFMIPNSWGVSLSRYLTDLSDVSGELDRAGAEVATFSGKPLGVTLPFASDWFLAVLEWPDDQEAALRFLVAAGGGASSGPTALGLTLPTTATTTTAASVTTQKISLAEHNPKVDGAIGALLAAAESAINSATAQIASALPSSARTALAGIAETFGIPFSPITSTVTVVLEPQAGRGSASTVAALSSLGVSRTAIDASSSLVKVSVSLDQLEALTSQLAGVSFFRAPYVPFPLGTPTEGTTAIGADAYHTAGITGTGVKVAIIDLGFVGLSQAQARGDLPYSLVQNDLTGTGLTTGFSHGTAVAEIVHDIAPDAQLYLIKIADEIDLDQAVTYCLTNGIDVINHSLGWYNTNYYDGTGTIPDIARRATTGGILWVNAAGNEAESHWEGAFIDGNADGWHDPTITINASSGSQIVLYLTWNEWPAASTDYDLFLYDPSSALVASSTKYQTGTEEPTESIQVTAPTSGIYTIRVQGTGARTLELYSVYQNVSPAVASSSILAPANTFDVIAVGAIDHSIYTTGPQESYSSQGPSNDGRTKPDLVAPDNVMTGTSPYTPFPGTSGSAPHAAAAAALLLSQQPSLSEPALRSLLLSQTIPMGSANVYGNGRLYLQPPVAANQPPMAAYTYSPASPIAGQTVSFNGSTSSDPDGTIVTYAWDFNDDGLVDAYGATTSHAFPTSGAYSVRLTVTDDDGAPDTETKTISVSPPTNQAPTASFTVSPSTAQPNAWISFDASASFDVDGTITRYDWTFGDGETGTGATTFHRYTSPATYTVQLTVTDDDFATATTTRQVVIQPAAAADLTVSSLTASPSNPSIGQTLTFSFTITNVGNTSSGTFRVKLQGSGTATQTYISSLGAGASRSSSLTLPLIAASETFTVTADDLGQIAESNETNNTRSLTVTASATPPPTAEAGGPYSGISGQSIAFNGSGSTGSITSYFWTFGDGGSASGATPTHAYASAGYYTATLTVTGPGGQSIDTAQVSVGPPEPALTAQMSLPQPTYEVGESLVVTYTTNRTAYVYLCLVEPDNRVVLVYPNLYERTEPVAAGTHTVPGGFYTFRTSEPTGTKTLYLFAATSAIPEFPTTFGFGFPVLSTNPGPFRDGVIATMQALVGTGDWDFDTLSYEVLPETPTTGTLEVTSVPSSATVRLDGVPIGNTPLTRSGVTPGLHTVAVSKSGYETETRQVTITAGATSTVSVTLVALPPANQPPNAAFTFSPTSPFVGESVGFDAQGSSDPDGSIVAYEWNFGDGDTGTGALTSHAFPATLTYPVTLTVRDDDGATDSVTHSITVRPSDDIGWVSPVGHEDPAAEWSNPQNAYDNNANHNDDPGSRHHLGATQETSPFLFLSAPAGGIQSDRIRFLIGDSTLANANVHWDIDVERDGAWVDVFDGDLYPGGNAFPPEWKEIAFSQGLVTRARFRFTRQVTGQWRGIIYEVDFHDATVP